MYTANTTQRALHVMKKEKNININKVQQSGFSLSPFLCSRGWLLEMLVCVCKDRNCLLDKGRDRAYLMKWTWFWTSCLWEVVQVCLG